MAITQDGTEALLTGPSDALTIYTPTAGTNGWLDGFNLCNTSAGTVTVEIWRGSPTAAGSVLKDKSLVAGASYPVKELTDSAGMHDNSTNNTRLTITPGMYWARPCFSGVTTPPPFARAIRAPSTPIAHSGRPALVRTHLVAYRGAR